MLLRLDTTGSDPLHDRIAAAVRRAVADGDIGVGDRLPGARDLAESLDVNVNTVLRAYRLLRDEGLLELRRGRGATVIDSSDRARLHTLADGLLAEARRQGLSPSDLSDLLKERS